MTRNLKALGLALFTAFAMSAVAAAGAQAQTVDFHSDSPNNETVLTGEQHAGPDVFTTDSGEVTCEEATYEGLVEENTTTTVAVDPHYSECHIIVPLFGTISVNINTNGCTYVFHAETTDENEDVSGSVDIVCPGANEIEVSAAGCTTNVPAQEGLKTITFTNKGGGAEKEDITVDVGIQNEITYEQSGFLCSGETGTLTHNGSYEGAATVKGYKYLGGPTGETEEGDQVNVTTTHSEA